MDKLTIVTTLIAAIAPSVVSILNYRHQLKINEQNNAFQLQLSNQNNQHELQLKKFENYYSQKAIVVNNYLENLTSYRYNKSEENLLKYNQSIPKLPMYVDKRFWEYVKDIDYNIKDSTVDDKTVNDMIDFFLSRLTEETQDKNKAD